jgi:phosphopantetheinyl transferase (holo-ACP synthase)
MLGNDLIDLTTTTQHTPKRFSRYLRKVFTAREREAIRASRFSFFDQVLWAAKEAAYKAYMQVHPEKEKFYAPKKFEVQPAEYGESSVQGSVHFGADSWHFEAIFNTQYIHCVACIDEGHLSKVTYLIAEREAGAQRCIEHPQMGMIHLKNNNRGIPEPLAEGKNIKGYASVSHDGKWIAYAVLLPTS